MQTSGAVWARASAPPLREPRWACACLLPAPSRPHARRNSIPPARLLHACSSQPQARIPTTSGERVFDIKYYSRDVRKHGDPYAVPIDKSFTPEAAKIGLQGAVTIAAPKTGSPGVKVRAAPSWWFRWPWRGCMRRVRGRRPRRA